jgi:thioredoxin reductase
MTEIMKTDANHNEFEYLIIGAGPAGLQLGYYLERAKRNYIILEANAPGHFFTNFPRHRRLISNNKIHTGFEGRELNLRWDWNSLLTDDERLLFKNYSQEYFPPADTMVKYLGDVASILQLNLQCGVRVARISKPGDKFVVTDQLGNQLFSSVVIVATGVPHQYIPPIPGIEHAELYTEVSINPQDFVGQRVLIIGKGNSAFETAENLIPTTSLIHLASRHPVQMAWKSHYVGHVRAVNNNLLDTYLLKGQNALVDASIEKIERVNGRLNVTYAYAHADSEKEEILYDRLIVCTGFRFDDSIFDDSCRPVTAIDGRFPAQTSEWESVNVPSLYFAGALMHVRDFKKKQSGFIHGFRYNINMLHSLLELKYYGKPLPRKSIAATPEAITHAIIARANETSALWQQTGFMCDLIVVHKDGGNADYYNQLTMDYVQDNFSKEECYYTITLEFGQERIDGAHDIFQVARPHKNDVTQADQSTGIHPIVRRYCCGKLLRVHHVIEDFASEWQEDVHVGPLTAFMASEFSMEASHSEAEPARV